MSISLLSFLMRAYHDVKENRRATLFLSGVLAMSMVMFSYGAWSQEMAPNPIPGIEATQTATPTTFPTFYPTPTYYPTYYPTATPTYYPTVTPTYYPTTTPTYYPTPTPTYYPTATPTYYPTPTSLPVLTVHDAQVYEGHQGSSVLTFPITLSAPSSQNVIFNYMTVEGTATLGQDFSYTGGEFTLIAGQTYTSISIAINGDTVSEDDETVQLLLSDLRGARFPYGSTDTGIGTILNDDGATPTPTYYPTSTPTYYPTATPTYYPTSTPTYYPTATPTPTYYPTATPTPTYYPTATPTPTYYPTATPTPTYYPTATPTPTYYPTATPTATYSPTPTPTPESSNRNPIAIDDFYEDVTGTIIGDAPGLLINDSDPDGDPLSIAKFSDPSNGSVTINPDGSFQYVPVAGYVGSDIFYYFLSDGQGGSAIGRCFIKLNPTTKVPSSKPDIHVRSGLMGSFIGDNIYSSGAGQTVSNIVAPNQTAIYSFALQNDKSTPERLRLIANASSTAAWNVRYLDPGNNDITVLVKGAGWQTPATVAPGEKVIIIAEVTPTSSATDGSLFTITANLQGSNGSFEQDTAKADTVCRLNSSKGDMLIQNISETSYLGDNIYESNGATQVKSQSAYGLSSVVYSFVVQNDGYEPNSFRLAQVASITNPQWNIRYWSAKSGGQDITSRIVAGTFSTPVLQPGQSFVGRVEVVQNGNTPANQILDLVLKSYSASSTTADDAVRMSTTALAPTVLSLSLAPTSVVGGDPSQGTVTLTGKAFPGGLVVSLSSNNPVASVPSTVTIPEGASSATFNVATSAVTASVSLTITASGGGQTRTAPLTVRPMPTFSRFSLSPLSVYGGDPSTGTVTLTGAAPSGGVVIPLSSNNSSASVPSSVTVPANAVSASFTVTTFGVEVTKIVTITAAGTDSVNLEIKRAVPGNLTLSPASVIAGQSSTGTLTLLGKAPVNGLTIALSSNVAAVGVPSSVSVSAGASSVSFPITTTTTMPSASALISATANGVTKSAYLTVTSPFSSSSLTLSPASVIAGQSSTGTLTFSAQALPTTDITVTLSSNVAAVGVPASVTVNAGASSVSFPITTSTTMPSTSALISATANGATKSAYLTVTSPFSSATLTLSPASVIAGQSSTGTLTFSPQALPITDITVALSSNVATVGVPSSVVVSAGASSVSFPITTTTTMPSASALISATANGVTKAAYLTVTSPFSSASLTLSPTSVVAGQPSTGTLTFSPQALPTTDFTVALSSNVAAVGVPSSVSVSAGASSVSFPVTTSETISSAVATITATANGASKTAYLTVTSPFSSSSLTLSPASVTAGQSSTGTLTFSSQVLPTTDFTVALSSNVATVGVPSSVSVSAGASSVSFPITTTTTMPSASALISATYKGATKSAYLTVNSPFSSSSLTVSPASVIAGQSSTGTLTFSSQALPTTDITVSLSSNVAAVGVPPSVSVSAGASSVSFPITTSVIMPSASALISATANGATRSAYLTVTATSSLTLSPTSVVAGQSSTGTVTLLSPAPANGINITLSSNKPSVVVPESVVINEGQSSVSFPVTTILTTFAGEATISANVAGATRQAILTVVLPFGKVDALINTTQNGVFGNNVYSADGSNQKLAGKVFGNGTSTYYMRVENEGNQNDTFKLKSLTTYDEWDVQYFDSPENGTNISDNINQDGYEFSLDPGLYRVFRITVKPRTGAELGESLETVLKVTSNLRSTVYDTVILSNTVFSRVDAAIRREGEYEYTGVDIFNSTGYDQTVEQACIDNVKNAYYIRIKNVSTTSETVKVYSPPTPIGWQAEFFDAPTGGNSISSPVHDAGWTVVLAASATKDIRVEVTRTSAAEDVPVSLLTRVETSTLSDPGTLEVVTALTAEQSIAEIQFSIDGGLSWEAITPEGPLPAIPAGVSLGLRAVKKSEDIDWPLDIDSKKLAHYNPSWVIDGSNNVGEEVWSNFDTATAQGQAPKSIEVRAGKVTSTQARITPNYQFRLTTSKGNYLAVGGLNPNGQTMLSLRVLHWNGSPVAGLQVRFAAQNDQGSAFGEINSSGTEDDVVVTDSNGVATVSLSSGASEGYAQVKVFYTDADKPEVEVPTDMELFYKKDLELPN